MALLQSVKSSVSVPTFTVLGESGASKLLPVVSCTSISATEP